MTGVSPRPAAVLAVLAAAGLALFAPTLSAQTAPTDDPGASVSPGASPPPPGSEANPALPPYAPSSNAASPLLPASPPLPPRPSVPNAALLPDGTPPPPPPPFPLPVAPQTATTLFPANTANGAPGAPPATPPGTGAVTDTTTNTGAVRRFQYAFSLTTGVTYDDNVFLTANGSTPVTTNGQAPAPRRGFSRGDVYFSVTPSLSLGYGDTRGHATNYVEFDYTANALLFTKNTDQDTVEHSLGLQGGYHFAQVTLTLSQGVQILDGTNLNTANSASVGSSPSTANTGVGTVNLDASRRTGLNVYTTQLNANYALSDKTSFDLGGYFSASDYETLISSDTISGSAYFNYAPTGKILLGLGVSGGYVIQDQAAPDEFYQQINLRLNYVATSKLSIAGSVGVEFREASGTSGEEVNPIFDLSINYAPFDSTSISLAASRSVQTSAVLTGQNFDSTGFTFNVSQRFFQRVTARLSLGYTHSSYVSSGTGVATNRNDDYYFVQPGLDCSIRDNLSAGLFYIHRQSSSSLPGNSFNDNQIGARLSFTF